MHRRDAEGAEEGGRKRGSVPRAVGSFGNLAHPVEGGEFTTEHTEGTEGEEGC